ncbi:MAG: peptide chain release factor N(5)-glutamine methyltransferase [Deltaproteobacteria bacterium]|nr:MAG: peptide chain release factor N(5)-glutamine methyltransferase [Deltaproteobacteria bacterium]
MPSPDARKEPRPRRDWTFGELLDWTRGRFAEVGIDSPRLDAELLLAEAAGCARIDLYLRRDDLVDAAVRNRFRDMVRRRLAREPVAYILGRRDFHALELELYVDANVLVPRPETELLVDWILEDLPADAARPPVVLDVGTGSGAIALAIGRARPDARICGIDPSEAALEVARRNAERLDLHVEFRPGRAADLGRLVQTWAPPDVVAANLPYVASADLEAAAPELSYEPRLALDGGPSGLDVIEELVAAVGHLDPRPDVYLEIGADQADAVTRLLRAAGYAGVDVRPDLAGRSRLVRARRARTRDATGRGSPPAAADEEVEQHRQDDGQEQARRQGDVQGEPVPLEDQIPG